MKARLKRIGIPIGQSFSITSGFEYHAYHDFHYHPEIELLYIVEGAGILLVGDLMEQVATGDMFLLGANLPHMFRFETHAYNYPLQKQGVISVPLQVITLHFSAQMWGEAFINMPENAYLDTVIKNADRVQVFHGELKLSLIGILQQLLNTQSHQRMFLLMQALALIATGANPRYLDPQIGSTAFNPTDETRLTKVYLYTLNNFQRTVTLNEIAATIYMCPNAFCRYFKSRTNKSYFDFLLEVRINHARKLLKETNYSIVIISYECGFSNLSNFNRRFKAVTNQTPLLYRKTFNRYLTN
jgi:AraC-like DNA-binding protein